MNCGSELILFLCLDLPIWELKRQFYAGVIKVAIAVINNFVLS
jgi:hypothetical protein